MDQDTRLLSKQNWNSDKTWDGINAGSLQRIADATEKMAGNYTKLQNDLKWAEERADRLQALWEKEQRRSAAYRGIINRLKKK